MPNRAWKLAHFQPISFCNIYSLHLLGKDRHQMVLDINGIVHLISRSAVEHHQTVSLKQCLDEPERSLPDFDLEMVVSDSLWLPSGLGTQKISGFIGTCWVVYDHLFATQRQFAALFTIAPDFSINFVAKIDLEHVPTFTKLEILDEDIRWLVFTYGHGPSVYVIKSGYAPKVDPIIAPALSNVPGSVIRRECISISNTNPDHRLVLVGFDTGFVVASIEISTTNEDNQQMINESKSLKFDGPISVLIVLTGSFEGHQQSNGRPKCLAVLISSTIGSATIWTLKIEDNDHLSWEFACILLESELCDTVVTGAVYRRSAGSDEDDQGLILIGTYGEQMLAYDLHDVLHSRRVEFAPAMAVNIASPILAIAQCDEELLILSSRGLHCLKCSSDEVLFQTQQRTPPYAISSNDSPTIFTNSEPSLTAVSAENNDSQCKDGPL